MLIGKPNCGKTTTCRLLYNELISCGAETVKLNDGGDFSCSLKFLGKTVFIKSAGDSQQRVQDAIDKCFDIVICTCRATFTDKITNARIKSNGDFIPLYKEDVCDECAKNLIINILKS